jgi:hypothetical protein
MSTRSALDPTRSVTVECGRVNLNALCGRFPTTAAEDLSIRLDGQASFDRQYAQCDPTRVGV